MALVWFIVGGFFFSVLAGGGFAELTKKTLLARLKQKAAEQQRCVAEESGIDDVSKVSKPWWWVALLGVIALVAGAAAMALVAEPLGYPTGVGLIVGVGGGVNATWLWQPAQRAVKAAIKVVVGWLKRKFGDG